MKSPWLCLLLLTVAAHANPTNDLLAHFRLETDGQDSLGRSPPAELRNAAIREGSLFLNGCYENRGGGNGFRATFPIRRLDYKSFTVALDFYPLSFQPDRNLNAVERKLDFLTFGGYWRWLGPKRSDNANILTGGTSHRWLGCRCETNTLQLTLNNQAFVHVFSSTEVSANRWHNLICSVDLDAGIILTQLDGQLLEAIHLPPDFKLNIIGAEAEPTDGNFSFANYSNGSAFYGHAAHLKVFGRALDKRELDALYVSSTSERAALQPKQPAPSLPSAAVLSTVGLLLALTLAWFIRKRSRNQAGQ